MQENNEIIDRFHLRINECQNATGDAVGARAHTHDVFYMKP